ncbi:hypothetical protein [Nostoc sp.]|uniref:hypothetical protein n=1 Tax=Nostoc sp. TaxID=1180 RepID=UPI002FFA5A16
MALRKDTAFALTGSQPLGWEPILGGFASISLTRGRASFKYIPSLEAGNKTTQAFGLYKRAIRYWLFPLCPSAPPASSPSKVSLMRLLA